MTDPTPRQKLIKELQIRLGGGIVDNELDPEHYDYAVQVAIDRYRVRSGNAMEESFLFLDTQPDVQVYTLPDEVQEVRDIYRRTIGATGGGGASIDPFSLAFSNNLYSIQNPGGMGGGGVGTLATYELAMQYQELVGRMMGQDVQFSWNVATKKLFVQRQFRAVEQIVVHVYNTKPESVLLIDPYARPWLRDYALAQCKLIMAEARGKFASYAGPQGGVQLNADALKTEAKEELERLEEEVKMIVDAHEGYGFIVG